MTAQNEKPKYENEALYNANRNLFKKITPEHFSQTRASLYGGAGVSLACLLVLLQTNKLTLSLEISLFCFALTIPLFLFFAFVHEALTFTGERGIPLYQFLMSKMNFIILFAGCYFIFFVGIAAIIFNISVWAGVVFVCITTLLLVTYNDFHRRVNELLDDEA